MQWSGDSVHEAILEGILAERERIIGLLEQRIEELEARITGGGLDEPYRSYLDEREHELRAMAQELRGET